MGSSTTDEPPIPKILDKLQPNPDDMFSNMLLAIAMGVSMGVARMFLCALIGLWGGLIMLATTCCVARGMYSNQMGPAVGVFALIYIVTSYVF